MSILIVPLFISPVIVGQAWALMLQRPFGPTDYLLSQLLGHEVTISWLTESPWVYFSLIIADVWQWTPFMFVILLAGLTAIPPNLYEAAELDGVDAWQAFWSITLPHLAPMILLAITFRLLDAVKLFDTIFIMTGGGPGTNTYTTSFYLYTVGFTQFHLSQATAGSWMFLILTADRHQFLVRRLLRAEHDLMASAATPKRRAPSPSAVRQDRLSRPVHGLPAGAALLARSSPRSSRATIISPCRRSGSRPSRPSSTTPRRCSPIAACKGSSTA